MVLCRIWRFYGFQLSTVGNDYLSVHALYNGGKEISDDIVIKWNPDEQVFEIDPDSIAQMGSILVGTLTAPDGSALGQIYVDYISGNIFGTLHVMQEINGKEKEVYEVNGLGFYNTALGTKDLSIPQNNFYGYQLTGVGSDYFSLELLTNNGSDVSGNFTVGWDSDKKTFEIQSSTPQSET
jgi:hypothetical protein